MHKEPIGGLQNARLAMPLVRATSAQTLGLNTLWRDGSTDIVMSPLHVMLTCRVLGGYGGCSATSPAYTETRD